MGNCQAIDNASIVIQHPNAAKIERLYSPISAADVMKTNPGHYVALLLTTTLYSSSSAATSASENKSAAPLRVTRIKLLRPADTLVLGHVYRLVTTQEVMKGLWAKKQAKMQQQQQHRSENHGKMREKQGSDFQEESWKADVMKTIQVKQQRHPGASKSRSWQPALKSISEAAMQ